MVELVDRRDKPRLSPRGLPMGKPPKYNKPIDKHFPNKIKDIDPYYVNGAGDADPVLPIPLLNGAGYQNRFCDVAKTVLGRGHSIIVAAAVIGVPMSVFDRWRRDYIDFDQAVEVGLALSAKFWEDLLIAVAQGEPGNAQAIIFALKSRGRRQWSEDQMLTINARVQHATDMSDDELLRIVSTQRGE